MLRNMTKVIEGLSKLTIEEDGVDGHRIQQYAEAWSFGEVFAHLTAFGNSEAITGRNSPRSIYLLKLLHRRVHQ